MPESEAPLAAKREFGFSAVNQEHCRDMRRRRFIDDLTRDLLFTLRTLKKSPGFTAMALLSLALSHNQYYLISLQAIDGVAMGIYGVLLTLITADLSKGSGRYNFVRGAVQSAMGLGGVLSNSLFGWMERPLGFNASFYGLTTEALGAFALSGTKRRLALIGKGRALAKSANHTRPG
jgi:MFS family permease